MMNQEEELDKLSALTAIANIADEIVDDAVSSDETLPPHQQYIVDGDLISKLAAALNELYKIEEQQSANFAASAPPSIISNHEDSSDIIS